MGRAGTAYQEAPMQEFSVPASYVVKPDDNITDDLFRNEEKWPDQVGLIRKANGTWTPVTWRQFAWQVRGIAAGFIAVGIQPVRCHIPAMVWLVRSSRLAQVAAA
jgi:long-subunit acyl-CoA synthetase (AMP-forming)